MRKLLVVLTVLAMVSIANAELSIWVNDFDVPPDASVTLDPTGIKAPTTAKIDIRGNGLTPGPIDLFLINEPIGGATMSGGVLVYPGSFGILQLHQGEGDQKIGMLHDYLGYNTVQAYYMLLADSAPTPLPLTGLLVDNITLHCDAIGDVKLTLMNLIWVVGGVDEKGDDIYIPQITVYDTQIIHQIPEPMTIGLLGLGGLFLRRRK